MNNSISIEEVLQIDNPTIVDIREYYYYNIGNNHNHHKL